MSRRRFDGRWFGAGGNPHGSNSWIRRDKRLAIYLRDGWRCVWCGESGGDADAPGMTLDHLRPRTEGGSNEADNLVTSCLACNTSRQPHGGNLDAWARALDARGLDGAELVHAALDSTARSLDRAAGRALLAQVRAERSKAA